MNRPLPLLLALACAVPLVPAAEGPLAPFLGAPGLERQVVFSGRDQIREPYLAVALDGSILALRNQESVARRSVDGGRTWGEPARVPVALAETRGFRPPEVRALHNLVEAQQEAFILAWYEHFGR